MLNKKYLNRYNLSLTLKDNSYLINYYFDLLIKSEILLFL